MKILVTGSEGSLMQSVIPYLLDAGHEVRGVDNFVRYGKVARERAYEFLEGDLVDNEFADKTVKGVDGIIQAAARIYGVGGFHKYPADILSHDVNLHQNILWSAVRNDIPKVAYLSSSMVFERCEKHPSKEEDAYDAHIPDTDYGLSKLVGERLSQAFQRQYGIKYVIWRPFNIITPYEKGEPEQGISHVFADFINNIVIEKKNPLPIIGDGEQIRCFTWIEDVAAAIAKYSFEDKTDNQVYNLGNPEPVSMKQLAEFIYGEAREMSLVTGDKPLSFDTVQSFKDDVRIRIPDVSKAAREIDWNPTIKVREAVKKCLREIKSKIDD